MSALLVAGLGAIAGLGAFVFKVAFRGGRGLSTLFNSHASVSSSIELLLLLFVLLLLLLLVFLLYLSILTLLL